MRVLQGEWNGVSTSSKRKGFDRGREVGLHPIDHPVVVSWIRLSNRVVWRGREKKWPVVGASTDILRKKGKRSDLVPWQKPLCQQNFNKVKWQPKRQENVWLHSDVFNFRTVSLSKYSQPTGVLTGLWVQPIDICVRWSRLRKMVFIKCDTEYVKSLQQISKAWFGTTTRSEPTIPKTGV